MITTYIGIGSNLGDARQHVKEGIAHLHELPASQKHQSSSFFRSAPIEAAGNDYVNAVLKLETQLPADVLLHTLHTIEKSFGRKRLFPHAPRTLDLDLLLYGNHIIQNKHCMVPHPRLTQRAFVLWPLLELDAHLIIPNKGPAHDFLARVGHQKIEKIA